MLPDEIYAGSASETSSNFKYAHPLSHVPVDDGLLRAQLAYDVMDFWEQDDCSYYINPEKTADGYDPQVTDDDIDIMIVDGFYKEAEILLTQRLEDNPEDEKLLFQKAFLDHLKGEYERIVEREDIVLATDPKNVNALINKGFALANLNQEDAALGLLDKALSYDPDNIIALGNKAYIAKMLWRDEDHSLFLKQTYNASAKLRHEQLAQDEARLMYDMGAQIMSIGTPRAFREFNRRSGYGSTMVH